VQQHVRQLLADGYRLAFVTFQDPRARRTDWVLGEILHAFGLREHAPCPPDTFVECVASRLDAPSIVLLDEIEHGMRQPSLADLWGALRATASHHARQRLAFVLGCTGDPFAATPASIDSPLLTVVSDYVPLGPLTPAEAEALVASSPHPFPGDDVAWILERSGRWPALLQVLCLARWRSLERDEPGEAWKQDALRRTHSLRHLMPA
jgi:hypothetical protein